MSTFAVFVVVAASVVLAAVVYVVLNRDVDTSALRDVDDERGDG